jgi:hypothetical protein
MKRQSTLQIGDVTKESSETISSRWTLFSFSKLSCLSTTTRVTTFAHGEVGNGRTATVSLYKDDTTLGCAESGWFFVENISPEVMTLMLCKWISRC